MTSDPLSDILTLVSAQSVVTGGIAAGGQWAIRFPPPSDVKFYAIVKGSCWMLGENETNPRKLAEGDVVVAVEKQPYTLYSDPSTPALDARDLADTAIDGVALIGDGEDFLLLGGHVSLAPERARLLLDVLPPIIHVGGDSAEALAVQHLLAEIVIERRGDRAGAKLATTMLMQLVFLQVLRSHLATGVQMPPGWLKALADERLAPALRLMHGDPARSWQLGELAQAACMSRTTFALRFKQATGVAPLTYLITWRMRLAEKVLMEGNVSIFDLATSLGYASESAFINAFKRIVGTAPKRYRSRHEAAGNMVMDRLIEANQ